MQGYGTPLAVYARLRAEDRALRRRLGRLLRRSRRASAGSRRSASWWLAPIAFQKAILWSMLFEGLGLGCGSGPLTGRYFPPLGGVLYFLRPGTTKLPLFPALPLLGGTRRTLARRRALRRRCSALLVRALVAPRAATRAAACAIAVLVPVLGMLDQTIFLALRAASTTGPRSCASCSPATGSPAPRRCSSRSGSGPAFSKLNHHFPAVVCVMTSNSPFTRFAWLRRRMYRDYPDDLRPSRLADARWATPAPRSSSACRSCSLLAPRRHGHARRPRADADAPRLHHQQRADGRADRVERDGGVRRVRLFWAHPDVERARPRLAGRSASFLVVMLVGAAARSATSCPARRLVPAGDALLRRQLGRTASGCSAATATASSSG